MRVWFKENGEHSFMIILLLSRISNTTGSWIYWPCPENNTIIVTGIVTLSSSSSVAFHLFIFCTGFYPVPLSWEFLIPFLYHSLSLLYVVLVSFSAFPILFSPQVELQILVLFFSHYWFFIKLANGMKMWKGSGSATTLLFSLKRLEIVNQERRGQVKTIVMEHFNGIFFHKYGPANKQQTNKPTNNIVVNLGVNLRSFEEKAILTNMSITIEANIKNWVLLNNL